MQRGARRNILGRFGDARGEENRGEEIGREKRAQFATFLGRIKQRRVREEYAKLWHRNR